MEVWAIVLIVLGGLIVALFAIAQLIKVWAAGAYKRIKKNPPSCCDIDAFVGPENPVDATKVVIAHKIQLGNRQASLEPIPLEFYLSSHVDTLFVSRKQGDGSTTSTPSAGSIMTIDQLFAEGTTKNKKPIFIATIRMGFGHHRLAYSAASWAIQSGHPTVFHDLLNVTSRKFLVYILFVSNSYDLNNECCVSYFVFFVNPNVLCLSLCYSVPLSCLFFINNIVVYIKVKVN